MNWKIEKSKTFWLLIIHSWASSLSLAEKLKECGWNFQKLLKRRVGNSCPPLRKLVHNGEQQVKAFHLETMCKATSPLPKVLTKLKSSLLRHTIKNKIASNKPSNIFFKSSPRLADYVIKQHQGCCSRWQGDDVWDFVFEFTVTYKSETKVP